MDDEVKGEGNSINYEYRMHDPRIGRFFATDPLEATYSHNSPYAFSENVVINAVELEGREYEIIINHQLAKARKIMKAVTVAANQAAKAAEVAKINQMAQAAAKTQKERSGSNAVTRSVHTNNEILKAAGLNDAGLQSQLGAALFVYNTGDGIVKTAAGLAAPSPSFLLGMGLGIQRANSTSNSIERIAQSSNPAGYFGGNMFFRHSVQQLYSGNVVDATEGGLTIASAFALEFLPYKGAPTLRGADDLSVLTNRVSSEANSLRELGYAPATIVGGKLPNGATRLGTSGAPPLKIAPILEDAANQIGGIGTRRGGNTIGCCGEFRVGNELLLDNPGFKPVDIQFTPAIRPRSGEIVPPCQNCQDIFGIKP